MKLTLQSRPRIPGGVIAAALIFSFQTFMLPGAESPLHFLKPDSVDPVALLPAPPINGSLEQLADMESVVHARNTCSADDLAVALNQNRGLTAFNMVTFPGVDFTAKPLPKTATLLRHAQSDAGWFVNIAKKHFQRLRPSVVDTNLLVTRPALDFSYPSGHSTEATVMALILMDLIPDQADRIFVAGRAAGWHRVQLARHYPTDIQAGRVLGQAVFRAMKSNPQFQQEFTAAKAELASAFDMPLVPALNAPKVQRTEPAVH